MPKRRRADPGQTPATTASRPRDERGRAPAASIRARSLPSLARLAATCGLLGGLLGAPACTPVTEVAEPEVRPSAAAEPLPEPPAASDTIVIALRRLPVTLDPTGDLDPWGQRVVDDLLFEGLTRRLADAPWAEPALAERCVIHHEGRSVACKLRQGARFHDGEAVTVDDLLYSLNLWVGNRGVNIRHRYAMDEIRAVEAGPPPGESGEGWVRLTFSQRDPLVLERIAAMKIVPRARHSASGRFARAPIGSGPMQLVSQAEDRLVFARTTPVPGLVRQIELRAMDDGAAALTALRRGEIHLLAEVSPVHIPRELGKPGMAARFEAFLLSPARYDLILYNLREGPQAGPKLRSALDAAVPRAEIMTAVQGLPGLAVAAPVDLEAPRPIDLVAIAEDRIGDAGLGPFAQVAEAAADQRGRAAADVLLAELGWVLDRGARRRGTASLRLPLSWDGSAGIATGTARALRGAWKQVGIAAPSVTAGWPFLLGLLRAGKFSMALARLAGPSDMDLFPWFHSRGAHNLTGISDNELDRALDAYHHAASRSERDAAKAAISTRLVALHPVSVLFAPVQVLLASRALTGLSFVDDLPRLDRLGLQIAPEALLHGRGG